MPEAHAYQALVYVAALLLVWVPYAFARSRGSRRSAAILRESRREGLMEPASLHPVIHDSECIGCAACVDACPEHDVLGIVRGKAVLITPANCIGHAACKEACPVDAITLVLGTEQRGVDVPVLTPGFETNVSGVFVAGELGGMGLIGNAIEQGRQVIDSVRRLPGTGSGAELDVVIVGAGPAGFSASLAALEHGLRAVTVEQEEFGGTVAHYPRGKIVMTRPVDLPLHGRVKLKETSKESLLGLWNDVRKRTGVKIHTGERVEGLRREGRGFEVETSRARYRARAVVLAIGRGGTPRKLEVPGEDHSKVVYRLIEPEQYRERRVLVVGGGDSALEAATSLAAVPGTDVTLSYRRGSFSRAKPGNRSKIDAAAGEGRLRVLLESSVLEIAPREVHLEMRDRTTELANDGVIVCAGGILPTGFLRSIGVEVETKRGEA